MGGGGGAGTRGRAGGTHSWSPVGPGLLPQPGAAVWCGVGPWPGRDLAELLFAQLRVQLDAPSPLPLPPLLLLPLFLLPPPPPPLLPPPFYPSPSLSSFSLSWHSGSSAHFFSPTCLQGCRALRTSPGWALWEPVTTPLLCAAARRSPGDPAGAGRLPPLGTPWQPACGGAGWRRRPGGCSWSASILLPRSRRRGKHWVTLATDRARAASAGGGKRSSHCVEFLGWGSIFIFFFF